MSEYSYDADLAGLYYNFGSHNTCITVTLQGYNDKLHVLAHHLFQKARNLQVDPERLHVKKQELIRDWENFFLDQPYRMSDYYTRYLMTEKQFLLTEKLAEVVCESFRFFAAPTLRFIL